MKTKYLNWLILVGIVSVGLFLRLYKFREWYIYGHDQDLIAWIIRDIVINHHQRLIGQLTSTPGIFIGSGFYYFLVPFYLLTKMDPIGGIFGVAFLGVFGIISFKYIFTKIFNEKTGFIGALIYSASFFIVAYDRDPVPTMPVVIWTAWFFYALNLLLKGKNLGYVLAGLLIGLIWQLNLGLALAFPLLPLAIILSGKKISIKGVLFGFLSLMLMISPLLLFEIRHNFSQTKALITALTTNQGGVITGFYRFEKVLISIGNTLRTMLFGRLVSLHYRLVLALGVGVFTYLRIKKNIDKNLTIIFISWFLVYFVFFSLYSKVMSEYYLNGIIILWISIFSLLFAKKTKYSVVLITVFLILNVYGFITQGVDPKGYLEKKAMFEFIDRDRQSRGYPCVSISYITSPGYELGWRYLLLLQGIKTKHPGTGVPVYSLVYPQNIVNKGEIDEYFGALGLILPNYSQYNKMTVEKLCQGEDFNITDSVFGFTD